MRRASIHSQPRRLVQRLIVLLALAGSLGGAVALAAPTRPASSGPASFSSHLASA